MDASNGPDSTTRDRSDTPTFARVAQYSVLSSMQGLEVQRKAVFPFRWNSVFLVHRQAPTVVAAHTHLRAVHVHGDEVAMRQFVIVFCLAEIGCRIRPR